MAARKKGQESKRETTREGKGEEGRGKERSGGRYDQSVLHTCVKIHNGAHYSA